MVSSSETVGHDDGAVANSNAKGSDSSAPGFVKKLADKIAPGAGRTNEEVVNNSAYKDGEDYNQSKRSAEQAAEKAEQAKQQAKN